MANDALCRSNGSTLPGKDAVYHQQDDRPYNGTNKAGAFAHLVPTERLSEIRRQDRAHDAQNGRQNEP
jgi:hypothetical protein